MAKRLFTKRMSWTVLEDILSNREPFSNSSGTFRGEEVDLTPPTTHMHTGRMDEGERLILNADAENHGVDYVVWSYATPIAWRRTDGFWRVTSRNYSQTTACHLGPLRTAIGTMEAMRHAA